MKTLEFREITACDYVSLSKFFTENNVPSVVNSFTAFPLTTETAEFIACQPHKDKYYLYQEDGEILGVSMLRGWEEGYAVPSFGVFIDHRAHGKGLGKLVLRATVEEAKKMGCAKVRLSVYASNAAGVKIYKDFGFEEIERQPIEHNGNKDERIIMIKELL